MSLRIEPLVVTLDPDDSLRCVHLFDGTRAKQTFVLVETAAELQPYPLRHVEHIGVDRTGWTDVVDIAPGNRLYLFVDFGMRSGDIVRVGQRFYDRTACCHSEWNKDALTHEGIPLLTS